MATVDSGPVLGIDLGTTYCRVGVWEDGKVNVICNSHGMKETPSCVAFSEGKWMLGVEAKHQITLNPKFTFYQIRRMLGRDKNDFEKFANKEEWPFKWSCDSCKKPLLYTTVDPPTGDHGPSVYPEELAAILLAELKNMAEKELAQKVSCAVLSCPSSFTSAQRLCLIDAAKIAGIKVLRLVHDTTAAAINYSLSEYVHTDISKLVLFVDFGGGCCEMSLVKVRPRSVEVVATKGSCMLGGEDFDNEMALNFMKDENLNKFRHDPTAAHRLRIECEKAKCGLASSKQVDVLCDSLFREECTILKKITHNKFEKLCNNQRKNFDDLLSDLLEKIEAKSVADVVVTGGSTLLPMVKTVLQERFKECHINITFNTDMLAVVTGAATLASCIKPNGRGELTRLKLKEITPYAIELRSETTTVIISAYMLLGDTLSEYNECSTIKINQVTAVNKKMKQGKIHLHEPQRICLSTDPNFGIIEASTANIGINVKYSKDVKLPNSALTSVIEKHKDFSHKQKKSLDTLKAWEDLDSHVYYIKQCAQNAVSTPHLPEADITKIVKTCQKIISKLEENDQMSKDEMQSLRAELKSVVANRLPIPSSSQSSKARPKHSQPQSSDTRLTQTKVFESKSSQPSKCDLPECKETKTNSSSTKQLLEGRLQQLEYAAQKLMLNVDLEKTEPALEFENELCEEMSSSITESMRNFGDMHTFLQYYDYEQKSVHPSSAFPFPSGSLLISKSKYSAAHVCLVQCRTLEQYSSEKQELLKGFDIPAGLPRRQKYINDCTTFDNWYHATNIDLEKFVTRWEKVLIKEKETHHVSGNTPIDTGSSTPTVNPSDVNILTDFIDEVMKNQQKPSYDKSLKWLANILEENKDEVQGLKKSTKETTPLNQI